MHAPLVQKNEWLAMKPKKSPSPTRVHHGFVQLRLGMLAVGWIFLHEGHMTCSKFNEVCS